VLPVKNNVYGVLAAPISDTDTSIALLDASKFPSAGVASIAGGVDPYTNEVVLYTGITGNTLTGVTRGYDGTTAESHPQGAFIGLSIIAKHISDLWPRHGTTADRIAFGATLTLADTGWRFYDTDEDDLYCWVKDRWEKPVVSIEREIKDYYGDAATVLPLTYRKGDRWTDPTTNACTVYVCKATTITHTTADWVAIGRQN
jgi:hypothetical protein